VAGSPRQSIRRLFSHTQETARRTADRSRLRIAALLTAAPLAIVVLGFISATPATASSPSRLSQCPELSRGSTGPCVRALQTELNQAGVHPRLRVDGIYGLVTLEGVESFQHSKGLPADGVVGPQTARALDDSLRGRGGSQVGVTMSNTGSSTGISNPGSPIGQHVPLAALLIGAVVIIAALIIIFRFANRALQHKDVRSVRISIFRRVAEVEVWKHTPEQEPHPYVRAYVQSERSHPLPGNTWAIESGDHDD
jgi:hypothetical protein